MKITNPHGPNTTVLLPGTCNAHCDFCFWDREEGGIKPPDDYLAKVGNHLLHLPSEFKVISISGGEPTISPYFAKFLTMLNIVRRYRNYGRVVLTTHGGNLSRFVPIVGCVVDNINISRHGIGTDANRTIFKSNLIPNDGELRLLVDRIHAETSCDITFNCVVRPEVTTKFCYKFLDYAKELGADAVSFRKVASDVTPTFAEEFFRNLYGVESETECPVCRGMSQNVDGFQVRWKGSVAEPSIETKGIYEVVIHPDGNIYADWGMKIPLALQPENVKCSVTVYRSSMSSGCGSSGCGSSSGSKC